MTPAAASRAEFKVRFRSGPGVLRIDPLGLHFTAPPRRFRLIRPDQRFVARRQIRNVYRQAENVRIGFRDDARESLLEFWADDAAAASEIVGQLPTSHTVESDSTASRTVGPIVTPASGRLLAVAAIALVCVFIIGRLLTLTERTPTPAASLVESQLMRDDWDRYSTTRNALHDEFAIRFDALQRGTLDRTSFMTHIDQSLAPDWAREAARLDDVTLQPQTRRARLRDALQSAASSWGRALRRYANGLAADDSAMVWDSFGEMRDAEQAELEARLLVEQAQK